MLSFSTLDVLDEIWDVIESFSEAFLTYSFNQFLGYKTCITDSSLTKLDVHQHIYIYFKFNEILFNVDLLIAPDGQKNGRKDGRKERRTDVRMDGRGENDIPLPSVGIEIIKK